MEGQRYEADEGRSSRRRRGRGRGGGPAAGGGRRLGQLRQSRRGRGRAGRPCYAAIEVAALACLVAIALVVEPVSWTTCELAAASCPIGAWVAIDIIDEC